MTSRNKILTVDDSRTMRRLVRMAVETIGFEMLAAANRCDALEVLAQHANSVALILLDWNMPVMDGMQTLRACKADERFQAVPVLMVTREGDGQVVIEATRTGAQHYLNKPFSRQDLMVHMSECLGRGLAG